MYTTNIRRAVDAAGGQTALATALGIRQGHVSQWLRRGKVPADRVLAIEAAIGGEVTRYELRPDVFGDAPQAEGAS